MLDEYKIEKWIWTEEDFEKMGWHDTQVYAISFHAETYEIALDLDYIFEWVNPKANETYFNFWIAPATLVFENVYDIKMELDTTEFELDAVERTDPQRPKNAEYIKRENEWLWSLEAHRGGIEFRSVGYKQYIRRKPVFSKLQKLDSEIRGGISFHRGLLDGD